MSKENKGKDNNKNRFRKKEKASSTGKVTEADLLKLKEHFDKKFGRA